MTKFDHLAQIDHIQGLFNLRSKSNDTLFRMTLNSEILELCDTVEYYSGKDDDGYWWDYALINSTIILSTISARWSGHD